MLTAIQGQAEPDADTLHLSTIEPPFDLRRIVLYSLAALCVQAVMLGCITLPRDLSAKDGKL